MKRKRLLCVVLTLTLLFSAQPAVAANTGNIRSMTITANTRLPVIKVTVPTRATIYINPLRLSVSIGDAEDDEQIISTPACIANQSEVPLSVDVTVTGTVKAGSTMTLSSVPTRGRGTEKSAFVYFEITQSDDADPYYADWAPSYSASKHIVVADGSAASRKNILTLPAKTLDGEVAEGGYAPFRLTGDAVKIPTTPWNSKDGIDVMVAFTFTPLPYPAG